METAANLESPRGFDRGSPEQPTGQIIDNEYTFYITNTATGQKLQWTDAPQAMESPLKPINSLGLTHHFIGDAFPLQD
jgi:hypothetical protein